MRICSILLVLALGACGSPRNGGDRDVEDNADGADPQRTPITRVVYRQYYGNSHTFMMENLGGRDVVELRSKPIPRGGVPIAYVPDEVMEKMLDEFRRADYYDHAGPRPGNPSRFGVAELTIVNPQRRATTMIRRKRPQNDPQGDYQRATKSYSRCVRAYLAVWNFHRPTLQATSSTGGFGAKRVER